MANPFCTAALEPLDLLVTSKAPGKCLAGAQQRITAASDLLANHGSRALSVSDALLEEAIALLNNAQTLISRASADEKALLSEEARSIQRANRLLSAVVENGLSLYTIRLAKVLTDRGGYSADGRPAAMDNLPGVTAQG